MRTICYECRHCLRTDRGDLCAAMEMKQHTSPVTGRLTGPRLGANLFGAECGGKWFRLCLNTNYGACPHHEPGEPRHVPGPPAWWQFWRWLRP